MPAESNIVSEGFYRNSWVKLTLKDLVYILYTVEIKDITLIFFLLFLA